MCAAVGHAMVNRLDVIYVDTLAMDIPVCVGKGKNSFNFN